MAPEYGMGAIDWSTIASDPYFMQLQRNNVAFQAAQAQAQAEAQYTPQVTEPTLSVPQVDYSTVQPAESGSAGWVSGAMGATALISALAIGGAAVKHGGFKKGLKALGKVFTGKASEAAIREGSKNGVTILSKLTAVKGADGKIYYLIPNKTVTRTGNDAMRTFIETHGLQDMVAAERQRFISGTSAVDGFRFTNGGEHFNVQLAEGKISKILDKDGKDVLTQWADADTNSTIGKGYEQVKNIIEEFGKGKDINKTVFADVSNVRYTNAYGDDVLTLSMGKFGEDPVLTQFTTLGRYDINSKEMQNLVLNDTEKALIDDKILNGKLTDKVNVGEWKETIGDTTLYFNGKELTFIKKGEEIFKPNSVGFEKFTEDKTNKKKIENFIKEVFEDNKMKTGMQVST